ncbi:MAG: hypothetical protein IAE78_27135 [Myxococcus sp.]|nr:hypothetical protein [Myxococcus sp.]
MTAHHLLTTSYSETWAIEPRADVPFPLALELLSAPIAPATAQRLAAWVERYTRRGPRWQEVLEADLDPARFSLVLERFVGVTFADLVRNLGAERWVLPLPTWLRLALDLFDAFEQHGEVLLAEPPCPTGLGWSLRGELVLAPTVLNAVLATGFDVSDHAVLFAPEHVTRAPLSERSLVFGLGVALAWLRTGWHPLEAEAGGLVGGLLRGERPAAPGWKLGSPDGLVEVLERAMAHAPEHRFPTLGAFRRAVLDASPDAPATHVTSAAVLQAATHRLVDRLIEHLWAHDTLLPATWDGLWPPGVHPLEGLSVVEDRLLEHRVDRRTFARRPEAAASLRPWRTPPERAEDEAALRAADRERWWAGAAAARLPWRVE